METKELLVTWSVIGLVFVIAGLAFFGFFKAGRFVERRALTRLFVQMTQDTYYDGYGDGFKAGKKSVKCEVGENDNDGRY